MRGLPAGQHSSERPECRDDDQESDGERIRSPTGEATNQQHDSEQYGQHNTRTKPCLTERCQRQAADNSIDEPLSSKVQRFSVLPVVDTTAHAAERRKADQHDRHGRQPH